MQEKSKRFTQEIKQISKEISILSIGRVLCIALGLISLFFIKNDLMLLTPFLSVGFILGFSAMIRKKEERKKK